MKFYFAPEMSLTWVSQQPLVQKMLLPSSAWIIKLTKNFTCFLMKILAQLQVARFLLEKLIGPLLSINVPNLWKSNVHYQVHRSLLPVSVLSQFISFCFFEVHSLRLILLLATSRYIGISSGLFLSSCPLTVFRILICILYIILSNVKHN